jgi:hypothetical protein
MANQPNKEANKQGQQGAPQRTHNMPSSGNSPDQTGATRGTDETMGGNRDIERGGGTGTGTQRAAEPGNFGGSNPSGDPGKTPGKAEGVQEPGKTGNQ